MFRTALISMFLTSTAVATTWTVDDDGKADFDNIQAAVDASSDGDEIIVMPGTYTSKLPRVVHMKGKSIWLYSDAGPEVTIIDGQGIGRGIYCPSFQSDKTVIEGFTIRNGYSQTEGGGIRCNNDSNITIVNCILENCYSEQGGGGLDCGTSSPTIINCTFNKNVANFYGGGIRIANSDATIIDCVFTENQGLGGGGIYAGGSNSTLENCLFQGNIGLVSGGGIRCTNSNLMTLTDTTICGNTPDQITGDWTDNGGNTVSEECSLPNTWTVDDDGKADFDNIQAAVDASSDGDEIVVMPGTYTGTGDEVVDMRGKTVRLHSNNVLLMPIIDGEGTRRGILCDSGETSKTIIEGFTIANGYTTGNGGGIYNYYSSPTLTNCIFENNTANVDGGGMYNDNSSDPTLTGCIFEYNTSNGNGGGMYNYYNSPTLTNCTFTNNTTDGKGGGMHNYLFSSPTLTNCTFTDNTANYGAGMFNDDSSPTLDGCAFTGNTANDGGGMRNVDNAGLGGGMHNYNSSPTLTDCTFTNNTTDGKGGGMYNHLFSSPTLTNCTFTYNTVVDDGGGMYNYVDSSPHLIDCIFKNNIANGNGGGMLNIINSNPTLTDTTVCGNTPDQIIGDWTDNGGNTIADVCPWDCPADVNQDGVVDVTDVLALIGAWGTSGPLGDINADGTVDVSDLLIVIGNWGPCT